MVISEERLLVLMCLCVAVIKAKGLVAHIDTTANSRKSKITVWVVMVIAYIFLSHVLEVSVNDHGYENTCALRCVN